MNNYVQKIFSRVVFVSMLIFALSAVCLQYNAYADQTRRLDFWGKSLPFTSLSRQSMDIDQGASYADKEILLESTSRIYGFTISGFADLKTENSLIRIVLMDDKDNEYLVYESYPLIANEISSTITEVCEETCLLNEITPTKIIIQLREASIKIDKIYHFLTKIN